MRPFEPSGVWRQIFMNPRPLLVKDQSAIVRRTFCLAIWIHLKSSGITWKHLESSWAFGSHLESSNRFSRIRDLSLDREQTCNFKENTLHPRPSGAIWNRLGSSGRIWSHVEPWVQHQILENVRPPCGQPAKINCPPGRLGSYHLESGTKLMCF